MNSNIVLRLLLAFVLLLILLFSSIPVSAAGPSDNNIRPVSDSYAGAMVTSLPTSNNYNIQYKGSDSDILIGNGNISFTPSITINRWNEASFTLSLASPSLGNLGNGAITMEILPVDKKDLALSWFEKLANIFKTIWPW